MLRAVALDRAGAGRVEDTPLPAPIYDAILSMQFA